MNQPVIKQYRFMYSVAYIPWQGVVMCIYETYQHNCRILYGTHAVREGDYRWSTAPYAPFTLFQINMQHAQVPDTTQVPVLELRGKTARWCPSRYRQWYGKGEERRSGCWTKPLTHQSSQPPTTKITTHVNTCTDTKDRSLYSACD